MIVPHTRMRGSMCLHCGDYLDCATELGSKHIDPSPGDITICFHCGHVMAFDDALAFRDLNAAEAEELAKDERVQKARNLILERLLKTNIQNAVDRVRQ